jgi:hypothetical protein
MKKTFFYLGEQYKPLGKFNPQRETPLYVALNSTNLFIPINEDDFYHIAKKSNIPPSIDVFALVGKHNHTKIIILHNSIHQYNGRYDSI